MIAKVAIFGPLDEEYVLGVRKTQFLTYCSSTEFRLDFANHNKPMVNTANCIGVATPVDVLTAQEFCRGVKRDMMHYKKLKEDKHSIPGTVVLLRQLICIMRTLFWMQTIVRQTQLIFLSLKKCRPSCTLYYKYTLKPTKGSHSLVSLKLLVTPKHLLRTDEACIELNCSSLVR
jgi:hypothetical protein